MLLSLQKCKRFLLKNSISFILVFICECAFAGPPFINDDPIPCGYKHLQLFTYSSWINATHTTWIMGPAMELDYGFIPNADFEIFLPFGHFIELQGPDSSGIGDLAMAMKYKFLNESKYFPAIAIVPRVEFPTGNAHRNLGNGRLWTMFPLWLEKTFGSWILFGGGGYGFNQGHNQKNFAFGGVVLEHNVNDDLTLGAEYYAQGKSVRSLTGADVDLGTMSVINLGMTYNIEPSFQLLLSLGHSISATKQWVGYLGLYSYF